MTAALIALRAILMREMLRFIQQRSRFIAALVRPLLWLLIFAAGFRAAVDLSIAPPYDTKISYETYILPGLCGMILLFNGMQSSLSLVYDREMGSMRILLMSPVPRWWLLFCKLLSSTVMSILQIYTFLLIAALFGTYLPPSGYIYTLPAFFLGGLMLGALGLALSSTITQLENFAGVMNFVIFPMFFLSSALYPLATMAEGAPLFRVAGMLNPFSQAVELIRFALYGQLNIAALIWVLGAGGVFLAIAIRGYDPARGISKTGR